VTDSAVLVYLATGVSHVGAEPHGPEEDALIIHWVPFVEAVSMVERGEITDAKSSYGILLAARRQHEWVRE
jgi:hypothetical protein